eukprot:COSAG02_NODE_4958_length_4781_cov_2.219564_4_plen_89_part_00
MPLANDCTHWRILSGRRVGLGTSAGILCEQHRAVSRKQPFCASPEWVPIVHNCRSLGTTHSQSLLVKLTEDVHLKHVDIIKAIAYTSS